MTMPTRPKELQQIKKKIKNMYVSGLLVNLLFFSKVKIKVTLSRDGHFRVHFGLEFRGNRGSNQNFHGALFSGDCKIITPSHTIIPFLLLMHAIHI